MPELICGHSVGGVPTTQLTRFWQRFIHRSIPFSRFGQQKRIRGAASDPSYQPTYAIVCVSSGSLFCEGAKVYLLYAK